MTGTVYGVGLGPGDPDLMSVKASRLIRGAKHIAFFRKAGRPGHARTIVDGMLQDGVTEHPMEYPVTTEIPLSDPRYNEALAAFYEDCTVAILKIVQSGQDVVVPCEGDPFFYGSFMHLHNRLIGHAPVEVVPGITGMSAAWTATGQPITWGDDVLSTVMGTLDEDSLLNAFNGCDGLVVMKIGRNLPKVRRALAAAGKFERAHVVEFASMHGQTVRPLADYTQDCLPYFSIIIVHGQGRRP